jgi:hypothetical protein
MSGNGLSVYGSDTGNGTATHTQTYTSVLQPITAEQGGDTRQDTARGPARNVSSRTIGAIRRPSSDSAVKSVAPRAFQPAPDSFVGNEGQTPQTYPEEQLGPRRLALLLLAHAHTSHPLPPGRHHRMLRRGQAPRPSRPIRHRRPRERAPQPALPRRLILVCSVRIRHPVR